MLHSSIGSKSRRFGNNLMNECSRPTMQPNRIKIRYFQDIHLTEAYRTVDNIYSVIVEVSACSFNLNIYIFLLLAAKSPFFGRHAAELSLCFYLRHRSFPPWICIPRPFALKKWSVPLILYAAFEEDQRSSQFLRAVIGYCEQDKTVSRAVNLAGSPMRLGPKL